MSCLSCFQTPCCCQVPQTCGECSETLEYTAENINLAGNGVFETLDNFVFQFRGIQAVAPITSNYNATTKCIQIGFDATIFKQQTTFTDSAARNSATPGFLGQLGVQIDTGKIYIGTSLVVGGWTIYTP